MAPPPSTLRRGTHRVNTPPESRNEAIAPHICALCGKTIRAGDRFLTLSVDGEAGSRKPPAGPSDTRLKSTGNATISRDAIGTRRIYGHRRNPVPVTATCHLKCLHCNECGYPLSGPPRGTENDDRALLFDKGGAAAAYEEARKSGAGRSSGLRAFTVGLSLPGEPDDRWVANIFKNFVAHAKCAEHVCAVCGEVINPGEQQVTLPGSFRLNGGKSNDCGVEGGPDNSDSRASQLKRCTRKTEGKKMISQHVRCTHCATCGLSLATNVTQESSASVNSSAEQPQHVNILLDDSGRPHHSSCMACCCCRQPLFGNYEVHSFFGYLHMCQQALGDDPPLLPFPVGRAAALFGSTKTRGKACLLTNSQSTSFTRNGCSTDTNQLQELVTPLYGGLCCSWCQGRVPCCVSCERRCTVYTDANGQQFLPRALAPKAQRAAELAAAISLGHITHPPQPPASTRVNEDRKSGTAPRLVQSRGLTSDALGRIFPTGTREQNRRSTHEVTGRGALIPRNRLSKAQSSHVLKTAETHGVLCGQCASLSVVETEEHLRNCVDLILQFFREEGVTFSAEMMHLQHLMNQVSEDREGTAAKRPMGRKSGSIRQTENPVPVDSSVAGRRHSGRLIKTGHSESFGVSSKRLVSKEMRPLYQVEAAGVRVDLVDFDALNDGQPQHNSRSFLSAATPTFAWLPAVQAACGSGSMSFSSCGRFSGSSRTWESASLSVVSVSPSQLICGSAPPSVGASTPKRTLAGVIKNDADQHERPASGQTVAGEPSKYSERNLHALNCQSDDRHTGRLHIHAFDSAVAGLKGHEHSRLLFGRCHVIEVSLVVAADAAAQFDKQVKAMQRKNSQTHAGGVRASLGKFGSAGRAPATSRASSDVALKRLETSVPRDTFAAAAACAASVEEEENQLSRWPSATKREEREEGGETNVAVTAGALLLKGSFAGGLLKTPSGLHAQGLCVRLVKRLVVVGGLPHVLVLQHLAHEFIHAFLACKQKVIEDLSAEEGACNVAAAAVLLRIGADLKRLLRESRGTSPANAFDVSKDGLCFAPRCGQTDPRSGSLDKSFELLLVRYRLWKMVESTDEVYGVGYRRCLHTVGLYQLTFGAFVSQVLKGWRK